jgi:hypothetical protein
LVSFVALASFVFLASFASSAISINSCYIAPRGSRNSAVSFNPNSKTGTATQAVIYFLVSLKPLVFPLSQ